MGWVETCIACGHPKDDHDGEGCLLTICDCEQFRDEPTDQELTDRPGVEGGIGYLIGGAK